ncbi:VOC family protein [Hymenobacter terricola]|uniref:VOC family protein n=1 Tax=Hymenobacter terricola TaxID=2819236 RepID=UPI001B30C3FF|nr:VOC family protein [Hymenobacter terricola]
MNGLTFTGVDHPGLAVAQIEGMTEWYCAVLGYSRWFEYRNEATGKVVWMLRAPDNSLLEIMPRDDTPRPARTTWTPGWSHLALRIADLDQAIRHLDQHAVRWGGEVMPAIGGGRVRNFYDPEGNMLQLLERGPLDT